MKVIGCKEFVDLVSPRDFSHGGCGTVKRYEDSNSPTQKYALLLYRSDLDPDDATGHKPVIGQPSGRTS